MLAEGASNGYNVIKTIAERSGGTWRPSPGSVYPTLQQLVDEELIEAVGEGRRTEYQLTDALNDLAAGRGERPVYGVIFRGRRYDTGDRADWIKANVLLGVDHPELGDEIRSWIIDYADRLRAQ